MIFIQGQHGSSIFGWRTNIDTVGVGLKLPNAGIEISDTSRIREGSANLIILDVGDGCAGIKKHPAVVATDSSR